MTFAELSIESFHEALADGSPTPGGGSAAAVTAACGAAAVEMVCTVSLNDAAYEAVHEELAAAAHELKRLRDRLHELADEDAAAFDGVITAFRKPKDDPDRSTAIQEAMTTAAEIPLETAEVALEVLQYAEVAAREGNQNAVTDAGTGAQLAHAAITSALFNVDINLGSISDESTIDRLQYRREELAEEASALLNRVDTIVAEAV